VQRRLRPRDRLSATVLASALVGLAMSCGGHAETLVDSTAGGTSGAPSDTLPPPFDASSVAKVAVGSSPVRGAADAWVTLVEFGDFECPFCGEEEPVVEALLKEYPNDLRLVWKNFPLTNIHPYAQGAAVAAVCAGAQGDFWPMHDTLFEDQTALTSADLASYALEVGVDMGTWQTCIASSAPLQTIDADVALGTSVGISGTPTFFVNGVAIVGAVPQSELESAIDAARAAAEASGVPAAQYYDTAVLGQ
jgi:protein-disulfide isomerase